MNSPKGRSLSYYLKKEMHPSYREAITKKLKLVLSFPISPDSLPMDFYRYYGQQLIRLELINEVNKLLMDAVGPGSGCLQYWAQELWDLRNLCNESLKTTREMIMSLIAHGNSTGFYTEEPEAPKTKSEITREIAEEMGIPCTEIKISTDAPSMDDLRGLPLPKASDQNDMGKEE